MLLRSLFLNRIGAIFCKSADKTNSSSEKNNLARTPCQRQTTRKVASFES